MEIKAQEYTLRSFKPSDASEFFYKTYKDESIKKYVPSVFPKDFLDAYEIVQTYSEGNCKNEFYLAIEKENVMVGFIMSVNLVKMSLDTSAVIFEQYRGNGIMTTVIRCFVNWLKANTEYENLSLQIKNDNVASLKQSKKCGAEFKREDENHKYFDIHIQ